MVYVPAGPFIMGTDEEHNTDYTIRSYSDANPRHTVNLPAFYIVTPPSIPCHPIGRMAPVRRRSRTTGL